MKHVRHDSSIEPHGVMCEHSARDSSSRRPRLCRGIIRYAGISLLLHIIRVSSILLLATKLTMSKPGDFDAVRKDIVKLLHQPEYDDGSAGPVLVRLAW